MKQSHQNRTEKLRSIFVYMLLLLALPLHSQVVIQMEKQGNVFYIPGKVNGLNLKFVFDTGASEVCISLSEAIFMIKNGYLSGQDIVGSSYSQIANGEIVENTNIILREVEVGGIKLQNVSAMVSHTLQAPLLFGQSAIQKLGPIQIDGNKLIIANGKDFKSEKEAWALYREAFQAVEAMQYDKAIDFSIKGIELTTDIKLRAALYDNLAFAYYKSGQHQEAINSCYKGLSEDFTNAQLQYNLGTYLYETGQYEQAENAFNNLLNLGNNIEVDKELLSGGYGYLGMIQSKNGQYAPAQGSLKKAIDLAPNKRSIGLQVIYNELAEIYLIQNKYVEAISAFEDAISLQPNKLNARYHKLAYCYKNTNQTDKAIHNFKKFLELFQSYKDLLVEMMSNPQEVGKENAEFAKEMFGRSIDATLWLGRLYYYEKKDYTSATVYSNKIISALNLGESVFMIGDYSWLIDLYHNKNNDIETAQQLLDSGLRKYPNNPDILYAKTSVAEPTEELVSLYEEILRQKDAYHPFTFDYATVYNDLAWTYYCLGKFEQGLPYAEKSVKMNANHDYSWKTLGKIYYEIGKYTECIMAMEKCAALPNCSYLKAAYELIGKAKIKLGKKKEGKQFLQKSENILEDSDIKH